jgi:hypothetical protein
MVEKGQVIWSSRWTSRIDKQHEQAAWTCGMEMRHGHASLTRNKDMQYGHAACTNSMNMLHGDMDMQIGTLFQKPIEISMISG